MKKLSVIVAHPDDEVLGVGASVRKYANKGDEVYCLILGTGIMSRFGKGSEIDSKIQQEIKDLKKQTLDAAKILGFKEVFFSDLPDQRFDSVDFLDIVKRVEEHIKKVRPETIYTHSETDLNLDHRITFEAVSTACRPCNTDCPKRIYSFEILSSTEWQIGKKKFRPNVYVDVEGEIKDKLDAMRAYKSELRDYPHSRSIEGVEILAKYRGLESGLKSAEAFHLVRELKK